MEDSSVSDVLAKPAVARFDRTAPSGSAILERTCSPPKSTADLILGSQSCDTVDLSRVSEVLAKPVVARFYRTVPSGSMILERIFGPPKSTADPHWGARTVILSAILASITDPYDWCNQFTISMEV